MHNYQTPLLHYERVLEYLLGYQNKYDFNKSPGKFNSIMLAMKVQSIKLSINLASISGMN